MSGVNPGYITIDAFKSRANERANKKKNHEKQSHPQDTVFLPNSTLHTC